MPVKVRPRRATAFPRASVDARNRVAIRSAAPSARVRLGRTTAVEGEWRLSRSHQLTFSARRTGAALPEHALLKAVITGASGSHLQAAWEHDAGASAGRQFRLSGRWQADASNRLTFLVEKASGGADRLVFDGGWEIGPHHELRYRQRRPDAGRREHWLTLDGAWDVAAKDRLAYRISGSPGSQLEFRASLQSRSLTARSGSMVYQLGIGAETGRVTRRIELFGRWKLNRDLSVAFEIPYAGGRIGTMRFEGAWTFGPGRQVQVALAGRDGRPLGLSVTLSREVAPDLQAFLQLRRQAGERAVVGGVTVRF